MSGGGQGTQMGQQPQGYAIGGTASPAPPALMGNLPPTQNVSGPDSGGGYPPTDIGFDGSGSDGGVGGQPADQMQSPLHGYAYGGMAQPMAQPMAPPQTPSPPPPPAPPQPPQAPQPPNMNQPMQAPPAFGSKPMSLSQFRPPQGGLQIQGNPTASPVQRPQQR